MEFTANQIWLMGSGLVTVIAYLFYEVKANAKETREEAKNSAKKITELTGNYREMVGFKDGLTQMHDTVIKEVRSLKGD